jgi:RNA polymerase sigma factor (sigma-70 family)
VAVQPPTEEQIGLVEPQRSLESVFTRRELLAKLRAAMGELQGKEREVIKLRYLEGLETDEIARRWGCTRRTVNCLCKHSRERLRRLMQIGHQEATALGL